MTETTPTTAAQTFQVDLRGLVDLLSHHLYSSPRVYVRELLQNAVDAITSRGATDARPAVRLIGSDAAPDGRMHCFDSGVGLDADDVTTFLATIGRSSKRDDVGFARNDMLGQFGIGLLSAFLVTDEIEVVSRKGDGPVVRWRAHADGSYATDLVTLDPADPRAGWLATGPGTCVSLSPRHGAHQWLVSEQVVGLAKHYGRFLAQRVVADTPSGTVDVAPTVPPWLIEDPAYRRQVTVDLGVAELGTAPFAVVPVSVPAAGLSGVALILGQPTHSGQRPGSRIYLKGMLLGDEIGDVLPEWAFFVRLVADTSALEPTASREALFENELLADTREALGDQLRRWLLRLAATDTSRMLEFLEIHSVAVKSIAVNDPELRSIVLPLLMFETNSGDMTLPELAATTDVMYVTRTVDDFRRIAPVGAAQGLAIVNGGYVFSRELVTLFGESESGVRVETIDPEDLDQHIRTLDPSRLAQTERPLHAMREALDRLDVDLELRGYSPASMAALYLDTQSAQARRERREVAASADETWAAILGVFDDGGSDRPRLLLNDDNATVRKLLTVTDPALAAVGAESLYTRALMMGHHRLRPADLAAMDRSFLDLLDRALGGTA